MKTWQPFVILQTFEVFNWLMKFQNLRTSDSWSAEGILGRGSCTGKHKGTGKSTVCSGTANK